MQSVARGYNPSVEEFLAHVQDVAHAVGMGRELRTGARRARARSGGRFALDGRVFAHVLLRALGTRGSRFLSSSQATLGPCTRTHRTQSNADEVEVVGAGMAAATEWLNALAAGARVVSVRRREPERRPLNLPRELFTRRGLASFHRTPRAERVGLLRRFNAPSYPTGRVWDEPIARAAAQGAFGVAAELNGAPQVICATGSSAATRATRCSRGSSRSTGSRRRTSGSCLRPTRRCRR